MKGSVGMHGHFYQPPRENPWMISIEVQDPGSHSYSLEHLSKNESRKKLNLLMENTFEDIEVRHRQIYEGN